MSENAIFQMSDAHKQLRRKIQELEAVIHQLRGTSVAQHKEQLSSRLEQKEGDLKIELQSGEEWYVDSAVMIEASPVLGVMLSCPMQEQKTRTLDWRTFNAEAVRFVIRNVYLNDPLPLMSLVTDTKNVQTLFDMTLLIETYFHDRLYKEWSDVLSQWFGTIEQWIRDLKTLYRINEGEWKAQHVLQQFKVLLHFYGLLHSTQLASDCHDRLRQCALSLALGVLVNHDSSSINFTRTDRKEIWEHVLELCTRSPTLPNDFFQMYGKTGF